jgi:hypothetical protein
MVTSVFGSKAMLVRLTSSVSGEVIMFAEHARQLFAAMGKECTARGVFSKEQLPEAIAALKCVAGEDEQAANCGGEEQKAKAEGDEKSEGKGEDNNPEQVALGRRAVPLIRLMERTLKEEGFILWEAPSDF